MPYQGRFAPSPSGPLHFGSLIAATGSYLQARSAQGKWLLRIEDLDPPREQPGATTQIIDALNIYGFQWDGEILYQSQRSDVYHRAIAELLDRGLAFPCSCSRSELAKTHNPLANVYPGTCRHNPPTTQTSCAIRLKVTDQLIQFHDRLQGEQRQQIAREVGDFVIRRKDGLYAYQLAVVIDDAAQGITEVVRGSDLLDSTPRQIYLQQTLSLPTPAYLHLPVIVDSSGKKISKQTDALPLDLDHPLPALWQALSLLGQHPPEKLCHGALDSLWEWALQHWKVDNIPRQIAIPCPDAIQV